MEGDFEKLIEHPKFRPMLIEYLGYRLRGVVDQPAIDAIIAGLAAKRLTTAAALTDLMKKAKVGAPADEIRGRARIRDIEPMLAALPALPKTYLDLGCGNGAITAAIGARLGLAAPAIIGTDIANWAGHEHAAESVPGFTFRAIREPYAIDAPDGSIDFATVFMTLHHIADDMLPTALSELRRVLSPAGILILREHDSPNRLIDALINIEHALFEVVIERLSSPDAFAKHYFGHYRTRRDWQATFAAFGFEPIGEPVISLRGTRPFYAMYRRATDAPATSASTPELIATATTLGATNATAAHTNAELQKMIANGRRATT
jgi:SAM-dependent methyltransferase